MDTKTTTKDGFIEAQILNIFFRHTSDFAEYLSNQQSKLIFWSVIYTKNKEMGKSIS